MRPNSPSEFLRDTQHAVRHLFNGIHYYESILKGVTPPSQARTMEEVHRYVALAKRYFGYTFSEAALCGGVLQVAFMGISLFSSNSSIPRSCAPFVQKPDHPATRFCIGREVHGIAIGLIIYAGRNQHSHWDDAGFNPPTTAVFNALYRAYAENQFFDLAYVLDWPERTTKAHYIVLNELGWSHYDAYLADMQMLIGN